MKKSLSLLVAIAMVFSMFASMASAAETPADAGKFLQDLKVIKGDENGDLMEDANWKRQDVAVLLSRLEGKEAEVAATAKGHTYKDVRGDFYDGYLTWAQEEGYMEGHSATLFGFDEPVTNQQFYAVVLRVLGVDTKGENYANTGAIAVEAGLAPADTDFKAEATRGETYVAVVNALNTEVAGTGKTLGQLLGLIEVKDQAVTAKVAGAKSIELGFAIAVDASKVSFEVKNATNTTINVQKKTVAENNLSATLEFASALAKGEYTITVKGAAEADLSAKVTVEDEKVAKIEFASDKAVLDRDDALSRTLYTTVKVLNQYGEDVTGTRGGAVTFTSGKGTATLVDAANGKLEIEVAAGDFKVDEKVAVSALDAGSNTFATSVLTVAANAKVAEITIEKLHHNDNKTLSVGSTAGEFKLVISAKDQYGNAITNANHLNEDTILTLGGNNFNVLRVNAPGDPTATPAVPAAWNHNLPAYTWDAGDKKLNVVLAGPLTAGTTKVNILSKTSGKFGSLDVTVQESIKVDSLTVTAPAVIPAGEGFELNFTAIDQFGNAITKAADLNAGVNSLSLHTFTLDKTDAASIAASGIKFEQDHVANTAKLKVNAIANKGTYVLTAVTGTNKVVQQTISVVDAAKPVVVSGIKDFERNIYLDETASLTKGNVIVKDQYGRDFDLTDKLGTTADDFKIVVTSSDAGKIALDNAGTIDANADAIVFDGAAKGSSTITIKLTKGNGDAIVNSDFTYTARVVDKADIASYEIADVAALYHNPANAASVADAVTAAGNYAKDLKVNGILSDGSKVVVPSANYTVTTSGSQFGYANGKVVAYGATAEGFDGGKKAVSATVVVNAQNGAVVLTKAINVTTAAPAIEKFELKDGANGKKEGDNVASGTAAVINNDVEDLLDSVVKTVDQYGVEGGHDYTYVVTNVTDNKALTAVVAGDSFNVTVIAGAKTFTFKVIVRA